MITLDVDAAVASITLGESIGSQTLSAGSRTITLSGTSIINTSGVMKLNSGTVSSTGTLINQGMLNADNGNLAIN
jgi:hypothetical protein